MRIDELQLHGTNGSTSQTQWELKKPEMKEIILYDSIYKNFQNRKN